MSQALTAWENMHYTAAQKLQRLLRFSIVPATEQVILVVEELLGLALS